MATAASQMTTRSQTAVASTSMGGTSTDPASTGTGTAPKLAHRKSIKLPALQCVCSKIFESKQFLDLHIGQKHKENFCCSGKIVERGKEI